MAHKQKLLMLYDDHIDVGFAEIEKLVQGLTWYADAILVPPYLRASGALTEEEAGRVASRLGELAEGGFIQRWGFEDPTPQLIEPKWWPATTKTHVIDVETYRNLQIAIREGVESYRHDLLRGAGRPAGSLVSGITEVVSLQDTLWTMGIGQVTGANCLLSADRRPTTIQAQVQSVRGASVEVISRTFLELHHIGPLGQLPIRDLRKVRRLMPIARAEIAAVINDVERSVGSSVDNERRTQAVMAAAKSRYQELVGELTENVGGRAAAGDVMDAGVSIAGIVFAPLAPLAFVRPIMNMAGQGRRDARFAVFLTKLKKKSIGRSR